MDSKEVVIKIRDLNPHVVCSLCAGYFVDATTITECLHTFCKSCIVKYFQTSKNCPMCNLQIHETQPLFNIRLDRTMQDIVGKLVPGILEAEDKRRREFYESRGMAMVKPQEDKENKRASLENFVKRDYSENKNLYRDDEQVSLCVERFDESMEEEEDDTKTERAVETVGILSKKYIRCSARMMVVQLQKLLRMKLNIPEDKQVDIVCNDQIIHPFRTMKFIWISQWLNREPPMVLYYRVRGTTQNVAMTAS
ncbi:polycomb group RING finger protein 1-like [Montipora capricornis]|uniref:polycomb group RING finger protein 1-like n=1 Tax=Montipora capricornis TaxID=246305 RepID=UPI0035F121C2